MICTASYSTMDIRLLRYAYSSFLKDPFDPVFVHSCSVVPKMNGLDFTEMGVRRFGMYQIVRLVERDGESEND